jgi:hypothetical protein
LQSQKVEAYFRAKEFGHSRAGGNLYRRVVTTFCGLLPIGKRMDSRLRGNDNLSTFAGMTRFRFAAF